MQILCLGMWITCASVPLHSRVNKEPTELIISALIHLSSGSLLALLIIIQSNKMLPILWLWTAWPVPREILSGLKSVNTRLVLIMYNWRVIYFRYQARWVRHRDWGRNRHACHKVKEVEREEQHLLKVLKETPNTKEWHAPGRTIQAEREEECQRFSEGAELGSSVRRKEKRTLKESVERKHDSVNDLGLKSLNLSMS